MRNWQNPESYQYTDGLNREQWAWEFLRRNTGYQIDYQWFINQWQALEKDYGKAPNMDYQAWKQDPRSYKVVDLDSDQDGHCAIAQDKLLIECWMGSKWGFFKFPRDPQLSALDIARDNARKQVQESSLNWRPLAPEYHHYAEADIESKTGQRPFSEIHRSELQYPATIDLTRPLKKQLEQLKQHVIVAQQRLKKQDKLKPFTITGKIPLWTLCLRYLDACQSNANQALIKEYLESSSPDCFSVDAIHNEAQFYVLHYLEILTFMEK